MSSNWEHKLYNYGETPPPSAWDAIAAGLDDAKAAYPDKLYNYQEVPPATAWQKIEENLQPVAKQESKVVAMPRRSHWVRYAAAAVLLLAIAGIAYFATPGTVNDSVAGTNNTLQLNTVPIAPPVKRVLKHFNVPPQASDVTQSKTKSPRNVVTYAANNFIKRRMGQKQSSVSLPTEPAFAAHLDVIPQEKSIVDTELTDRYMIATTEDGNPVRLPKKVYSAYACPDDEPAHKACELQLTLLQHKMSTSLTTDFGHFMDLLKNLQENTR